MSGPNCPSCGSDMTLIPDASLYRCTNCAWTVAKADAAKPKKRARKPANRKTTKGKAN